MLQLSGRALWIVFLCAVLVLVGIAVAADWTTAHYASSEYWVSHTQIVETRLIDLRADLLSAEAARLAFVASSDTRELPLYESSMQQIPDDLDELSRLTQDNPQQQQRIKQLRPLIEQRLGLLRESVEMAKTGSSNPAEQQKFTESGTALTQQIRAILDQADSEEQVLHRQRQTISDETYGWARTVLVMAFISAMLIISATFWRLLKELRDRQQAEQVVRQLSGRLMKVQDEERRRIARELHDSLGQLLSSLKMNLEHLASHSPRTQTSTEIMDTSIQIVQQSLDETRTLSYLLHPPLLDEFGFASAAKWYVDGFVTRSKIAVRLDVASDFGRAPQEIELALFRVLQESLTNIHRHSGSTTAEIRVEKRPGLVTLKVADHGRGMSAEMLEKFRKTRGGVGVGLAGMRERIDELGGNLDIQSGDQSTALTVTIPLPAETVKPQEMVTPGDPASTGPTGISSERSARAARASGLVQ